MKWSVRWLWDVASILCLFSPLPGEGFIIKFLNPEGSKNMELLVFVLHNNQAWDFVLNQKIQLTRENYPLYHDTSDDGIDPVIKGKLCLIKHEETMITPLPIIKQVVNKFGWLGSYIDFAVFVLHKAFMCTTFEFLKLQIEIIALMEEKSPSPVGEVWKNDKDRPLVKAWESVVQFIDKVAALHGNVEMLTDLSFEYTEFILENPGRAIYVLWLMEKEIDRTIDDQCDRTDTKMILEKFDIIISPGYLRGDAIKYKEIKTIFNKTIKGMITMFGNLTIQTMSMQNWSQILNFKTPVNEHINLYLKIDKLLETDAVGRGILDEKAAKYDEKVRHLSEGDDKIEDGSETAVDKDQST